MIVFNADDWGRTRADTDAALDCIKRGCIASVSAMAFMEDSERAAELAEVAGIRVGFHLNFTERFSGLGTPSALHESQERVMRFLKAHKYAFLVYHPLLRNHFRYSYERQLEEFLRLYRTLPEHINGHEHMHLCANMLFSGLIKRGQRIRRQQSFWPSRKGIFNRMYRAVIDCWLVRHYQTDDHFLELLHYLDGDRMEQVGELAKTHSVEMMAHPAVPGEYAYLMSDRCTRLLTSLQSKPATRQRRLRHRRLR